MKEKSAKAQWPFQLPEDYSQAQYGWGHTIDFGPFIQEGILGEHYLDIVGLLDMWGWWPRTLSGLSTADVGCFTGGISAIMAERGADIVYAVDEIPEHLAQCAYLYELFNLTEVQPVSASLYDLPERIPVGELDLILMSGVLYHLSDMLVGLLSLRELLRPKGILILESNAVDDWQQSYANFGRFFAGMWWQPSALCISDMCRFMGFEDPEIRFYTEGRCLVRTVRGEGEIPFKRGLNWPFESLLDAKPRPMDPAVMAPVRSDLGE
jgi:SAM-dependent methyltransferase